MATAKKTTTTRRQVSKARLLKELRMTVKAYNLTDSSTIGELDTAIRDEIVEEQMAK